MVFNFCQKFSAKTRPNLGREDGRPKLGSEYFQILTANLRAVEILFCIRLLMASLISLKSEASWFWRSSLAAPGLYGWLQNDPAYNLGGSKLAIWGDTCQTRLFWILSNSGMVISSALLRMILTWNYKIDFT